MAGLDYVKWDIIVPHHAWIKMGGSPDELKLRLRIRQRLRENLRQLEGLLVGERVFTNNIEHSTLQNDTIRLNTSTFITQLAVNL